MRLQTSIVQEQSFTETCLPLTMNIAKANMVYIIEHIKLYPDGWSFNDKVLAWLSPELSEDISAYYDSDGQPMDKVFQEHQIERLDGSFSRILKSKLEIV